MARGKAGKKGRPKAAKKKGPKKKAAPKAAAATGHGIPIAALNKINNIDKAVHRIENRLVPRRVKDRLARMHGSAAARRASKHARETDEASLAAKYG
jgi:hypothetical protein